MKKKTKFYALLLVMVLSLTQLAGMAVPVKAAGFPLMRMLL